MHRTEASSVQWNRRLDEKAVEWNGGQYAGDCFGSSPVSIGICHASQPCTKTGAERPDGYRVEDRLGLGRRVDHVGGALAAGCRMPTLTTGSANDAASIMPDEELPIMQSTCFIKLQ